MENKFSFVDNVLVFCIVFVLTFLAFHNIVSKFILKRYFGNCGYIAEAQVVDPRTGKSKTFYISKFLEQGKNYTRFLTQDGRIIMIKGTEVIEQ